VARYFISTADHVEVMDEGEVEVPNRDAPRLLLRQTLTEILHDEGALTGVNEFTTKAFDEHSQLAMQARASFIIADH
jgi:hypothetical protein